MRALVVERLSIRNFRNISNADLELGAGFNVISGDNGQGKTNLVEAIYSVATSRSFRGHRPIDIVRLGSEVASVRAVISEDRRNREQCLGLSAGSRRVTLDGKRPPTLASYAVKSPAVVFHPGEMNLSMGGGSDRRRLLDRLSLYAVPGASDDLVRYTRAVRERQRALETRGSEARDVPEWEELMVRHGLAVSRARSVVSRDLALRAKATFVDIAAPGVALEVDYVPGAPDDPEAFRSSLARSRVSDARRGSPGVGPHRDDIALRIDGQLARGFASQGQHRTLVLALKSAELELVADATGVRPLLILDDVSSELDRARTGALFDHLKVHEGQVFLTTTRPELIEIGGVRGASRVDFSVSAGVVLPTSSGGQTETPRGPFGPL